MAWPDRLLSGLALSAGRHLGRARHQLRGVLRPCHQGRALHLRSVGPARDRALPIAGMHRRGLARLHAQRARRPDLRLSRLRAVRAAARPSLQPSQAPARSLCQAHRRRAASVRCALRLSGEFAARRPLLRSARQRAGHAEGRRHRRQLQLGRRPATQRAVVRHGDLRGPCARAEHAAPGPAGPTSAAPSRQSAIRTSSTTSGGSASPRSS